MEQWISGILAASNSEVNNWVIVEDPMSDTTPSELRKTMMMLKTLPVYSFGLTILVKIM